MVSQRIDWKSLTKDEGLEKVRLPSQQSIEDFHGDLTTVCTATIMCCESQDTCGRQGKCSTSRDDQNLSSLRLVHKAVIWCAMSVCWMHHHCCCIIQLNAAWKACHGRCMTMLKQLGSAASLPGIRQTYSEGVHMDITTGMCMHHSQIEYRCWKVLRSCKNC